MGLWGVCKGTSRGRGAAGASLCWAMAPGCVLCFPGAAGPACPVGRGFACLPASASGRDMGAQRDISAPAPTPPHPTPARQPRAAHALALGPPRADGNDISPDVLRTLEREVGILVRIRHPNVILFMGVCLEPPCVVTGGRWQAAGGACLRRVVVQVVGVCGGGCVLVVLVVLGLP